MSAEGVDPAILKFLYFFFNFTSFFSEPEKQMPISAADCQKEQSSDTDSDTDLEEDSNFSSSPDDN
jgi:hypothetical protein